MCACQTKVGAASCACVRRRTLALLGGDRGEFPECINTSTKRLTRNVAILQLFEILTLDLNSESAPESPCRSPKPSSCRLGTILLSSHTKQRGLVGEEMRSVPPECCQDARKLETLHRRVDSSYTLILGSPIPLFCPASTHGDRDDAKGSFAVS